MDTSKLHSAIADLSILRGSKESKAQYIQRLRDSVRHALQILSPCEELETKINETDKITIRFIVTSLFVLKKLANVSRYDSLSNLISIQQQQKIKILLQLIFSIGIMPSLFRGVNILLANKTALLKLSDLDDLSLVELYNMMSDIIRSLFEVLKAPNLRSLVLFHLGDIMAALLQLIHIGEFKKPVKKDSDNTERKPGDFVMTEEWYNKLTKDRIEFRNSYNALVDDIYKPLVIRELLILLAPAPSVELGQEIAPPLWLRRVVSKQLSTYLTSPGGVSLIMRAMCDSSTDNVDWKKVEDIAKLISTVHGSLSPDEFYSLISPQIISLLNTTGQYCIPVAKACIKSINQHDPDICNRYIIDKLLEPFIICSQGVNENFDGILISEDSLSRCIDHINKCFAPGSKESTLSFKSLIKIIKIKFKLYMKVAESPYHHKFAIQDLLIRFFHSYNNLDKLTGIYNALIFNEPHEEMLEMNEELDFEFGPSGGIQVVKRSRADNASVSNIYIQLQSEIAGDCMLDLLSQNAEYSKLLLCDLFVVLLSSMSKWCDERVVIADSKQDLLNADELIVYFVGKSEKRMISIKLLTVLVENAQVMESIKENPQLIFQFVYNLLKKEAECLMNDNNSDERDESLEDLIMTLAVLDIMTMNMKVGGDKWDIFKPSLNSIKLIKDNCKDPFIKFLANLLYERIVTRGAVSGFKKFPSKAAKSDKLVNAPETKGKVEENAGKSNGKGRKNRDMYMEPLTVEVPKTEYEIAVEDACSDDVVTRGHGLIELTKLIKKMDVNALAEKDNVLSVLKESLSHEDSYIYLAAINGLEAHALVHTTPVLQVLSEEYKDESKDIELRLKVGEVLVRATRGLGEILPKHKSLLVNTFLIGAKHKDEYLRASSLSNLGEILKILRFGVGDVLHEVYNCIQCIAATDKSEVARRAAVLVAKLLLRGVDSSSFVVLHSVIKDLYRTLTHVCKTDKDEVTRLHSALALAEIDRIVKSNFKKSSKLEKKINVLNVPR